MRQLGAGKGASNYPDTCFYNYRLLPNDDFHQLEQFFLMQMTTRKVTSNYASVAYLPISTNFTHEMPLPRHLRLYNLRR